jgi:prophage antirepressor-like protein
MSQEENSNLVAFDGYEIRKTSHKGEWWFSAIDVIESLAGGDRPRKYWSDLKEADCGRLL